jgi:pimeloyl-ACP methyl ester carboxylesterase
MPDEVQLQSMDLNTADGVQIRLYRHPSSEHAGNGADRRPVLLLHGASANHRTFLVTKGGLAGWLAANGFDPWLLDWRGSSLVVDHHTDMLKDRSAASAFNINEAARYDVPAALERMQAEGVRFPIAILGHCMGGAVVAEAVAAGVITPEHADCVVLHTLGLFYEVPTDGRMKSQERILEQLQVKGVPVIDPRAAKNKLAAEWDESLETLYTRWPGGAFHRVDSKTGPEGIVKTEHMCNRLSFMYGMPYHHRNLATEIHASSDREPVLARYFGAIPLRMFLHIVRNVRQRRATLFTDAAGANATLLGDDRRDRFLQLPKVTLMTGGLNRLWHRDSIDRMYEWLMRGPDARTRVRKHIVPAYGHQDLLWGAAAAEEVFEPYIAPALRR